MAVVVLAIGGMLDFATAPNFSVSLLLSVFAGGLIAAFVKNIFEECAWRGYLTPKVASLGVNAYVGHGALLAWFGGAGIFLIGYSCWIGRSFRLSPRRVW